MRIISILLLALIALRGPSLLAYVGLNTGYVWFNHSVVKANCYTRMVAMKVFGRITESPHSINGSVWRAIGHIHAMQQEEQEAVAAWKMANKNWDMVDELHKWASLSEQQGNRQEALDWYERVIKLAPNIVDPWYFSARIYEMEGDLESAYSHYLTGLEAEEFDRVGVSDIAFRLGVLEYDQDQWLESLEWFNLALAKSDFRASDRAWHAYYLRGNVWRIMDESQLAMSDYKKVLNLNPDHYWAHIYLAQTVWLLESDFDEADALLLQATAIDATRKWAYRARGDLYRENHRVEDAIEMYRLVLKIDPQDRLAQHSLKELENDAD